MAKHWKYAKYLIRHKWFVFIAGLRVGVSLWRLVIHDWSKFLPCEWFPYAEYFYGKRRSVEALDAIAKYGLAELAPWGEFVGDHFDMAWLHHQKLNPHHWQYWILREDSGATKYIPIPEKFAREMVADWMGAGRAITGKWEAAQWYVKNRDKILMHGTSRQLVERLLGVEEQPHERT